MSLVEELLPLALLDCESVHIDEQLLQDQEADLADVAHRVPERPDNRVEHQAEHLCR